MNKLFQTGEGEEAARRNHRGYVPAGRLPCRAVALHVDWLGVGGGKGDAPVARAHTSKKGRPPKG